MSRQTLQELQTQDIGRFFLVGLLTLPVTYLVQFTGFAHTTATHASTSHRATSVTTAIAALPTLTTTLHTSASVSRPHGIFLGIRWGIPWFHL